MEEYVLTVDEEQRGERIDAWLAHFLEGYSRSYLARLIRSEEVLVNGKAVKANYRTRTGDEIRAVIPDPEPLAIQAEAMDLDILYEDRDLIFVNKPKGMVVHPAPGHESGTLVNGLMAHCGKDLSGINGVLRPGIVHRIDMDTTGVLVVCKNDKAHSHVAAQLAEHSITRSYRALVHGVIEEEEGTVDLAIGRSRTNRLKMAPDKVNGKRAVTHYRVLKRFSRYTYVECRLETGRTHQIRVHMTHLNHPLVGDTLYGNLPTPMKLQGQTLHAMELGLVHPSTGEYIQCEAPLPDYFLHLLDILE